MQRHQRFTLLLGLLILLMQACAGAGQFVRVDQFPEGEQINFMASAILSGTKDVNVVERIYAAPYEKAWTAVKGAAERFAKTGKRSIAGIDEKNGRIQNGAITQDALVGLGTGNWRDEFVMEATALSNNQTKVSVVRKVVELELISGSTVFKAADRRWKTQWSNGQIESWLHTQIEDELAKLK